MADLKLRKIQEWVRTQVTPGRFKHIQGVVHASRRIAKREGLPIKDAELAAWLHDSAKELPKDRMRKLIQGSSFKLDALEKKLPGLWHPHAGAVLALKQWGIRKPSILEAIRRHTLGAPGMGPLAQALFAADFVEPGRNFHGVKEARVAVSKGLREGVLVKASMTISFLFEKNLQVHPRLLETWNYFLQRTKA